MAKKVISCLGYMVAAKVLSSSPQRCHGWSTYYRLIPVLLSILVVSISKGQTNLAGQDLFFMEDYLMDEQHSYIGFKIKYFGFSPVRGRFNNFNGHILYDSSDLTKTSATIFIDVASINTGVDMRDNDLIGSHWFDTGQFPHIHFSSTEAVVTSSGFDLKGDLSIKGIKQSISISFEPPTRISRDFAANKQVDFSGRLKINRSDFGIIGEGFWNSLMDGTLKQLADEVDIEIDIHCRRPDYIHRYKELDSANIRKVLVDQLSKASEIDIQKLLDTYESATSRDSAKLTSGALNTIGRILLANNQLAAAEIIFKKRQDWYSEAPGSAINLARMYARRGNQAEVEHHLNLAVSRDTTNAQGLELKRLIHK